MLTIVVPGKPMGKGRPRFSRSGTAYTPAKTVSAENWVKCCAMEQAGQHICLEALAVTVQAIFPIPTSWPRSKQKLASEGRFRPIGKPDADNCAKLYLDSLNGIIWRDDSQVVDLTVTKTYGHEPKTIITVRKA